VYFEANAFDLAQFHYQSAAEIDPFPSALFNLALVLSITQDFAAAVAALTRYQQLVPADEARDANVLLESLKKSLRRQVPAS
jgi:Flp pilus assembly protein TadD